MHTDHAHGQIYNASFFPQHDLKKLSEYYQLKLVVGKGQFFLPHDILV